MYGQFIYILFKTLTMSLFGGLFQIIYLWMIYMSFATMHFSETGFVAFFFVIEDISSFGYVIKLGNWYYWAMVMYNVVSTYVLWKGFMLMHKE